MIQMINYMNRGSAAEYLVASDLESKGFIVCFPTCNNPVFDLVAVKGDTKIKIQVKSSEYEEDVMKVDVRRSRNNNRHYEEGSYDVLAVVSLDTKDVAYINNKLSIGKRQITIRKKPGRKESLVFDKFTDINKAII